MLIGHKKLWNKRQSRKKCKDNGTAKQNKRKSLLFSLEFYFGLEHLYFFGDHPVLNCKCPHNQISQNNAYELKNVKTVSQTSYCWIWLRLALYLNKQKTCKFVF